MRRLILPLIFGLAGAAVLISLGLWQVDRLAWKEAMLAEITARIEADPVALPDTVDPAEDRYLPVQVAGQFTGETIRVLVSHRRMGAGHRLITALDLGDRRILVDRGFLSIQRSAPETPSDPVRVTGNVHWPQERDQYTPENDVSANIWFAREVPALAKALNTDPILLIAREVTPAEQNVVPLPVGTEGIPNDHLEYVVTWFGLAAVWLAMLGLFLWRMYKTLKPDRRGPKGSNKGKDL